MAKQSSATLTPACSLAVLLNLTYTVAKLEGDPGSFLGENDSIVVTEVGGERASRRALENLGEL